MELRCSTCQRSYPLDTFAWRCACGGLFELEKERPFSKDKIKTNEPTLWRYRAMLPICNDENIVSLGEGFTPLVKIKIYGLEILCKLEFLAPTGSFKDRGTTVLVSMLKEGGIKSVAEDSSGNAAASLAAYCACAGIRCRLFVPARASPAKLAQISIYGAKLKKIKGPREDAARAAQLAVKKATGSIYYASHYYNPFSLEGLKTFAYEVCEQLGWQAPHNLIFPTGHGTFLLGAYRGFRELVNAGIIKKLPRLFAVQAQACSPLYEAWQHGTEDTLPKAKWGETIAEGINIVKPPRFRQVLQAIKAAGGTVEFVSEEGIIEAQGDLAKCGLYVEPTAAVAIAGLRKLTRKRKRIIAPDEITVIPLTGSGLKSPFNFN